MPAACGPWLMALAMLALTLFAPGVLNDGDSFTHLAAGDWMLAHHQIAYADPFSYTRLGAPWVSHEWLAEILTALAFRLAGWSGIVVLTAAAAAVAMFQLARHLARFLPVGAVLLLVALAIACIAPGLLARPHILALPALEAWIAGLFIARAERRPPSWWLLPVMVVWANLHGGFIIGLLMVLPLALEAAIERLASALRWLAFLLAGIAAAVVTPHGLTGLLFPFQLNAMPELAHIGEWQPTDFSRFQPIELVLGVGLYVALTRGVRLPPVRIVILLGLLHLALQHTRHQLLIGMIVPLLIAEPLAVGLPPLSPTKLARPWHGAAMGLAAALIASRLALPMTRTDGPTAPITALAHIPADLVDQPVFNDYAFGGYLIFDHVRPFIDGRADMYGGPFLAEYAAITHPDKAALEAEFARYHVAWTVLAPTNPAVALLDAMPHWCRLYGDAFAVVQAPRC